MTAAPLSGAEEADLRESASAQLGVGVGGTADGCPPLRISSSPASEAAAGERSPSESPSQVSGIQFTAWVLGARGAGTVSSPVLRPQVCALGWLGGRPCSYTPVCSLIQFRNTGSLVYTPGLFLCAQPSPQLTTPARNIRPSDSTLDRGPPESPCGETRLRTRAAAPLPAPPPRRPATPRPLPRAHLAGVHAAAEVAHAHHAVRDLLRQQALARGLVDDADLTLLQDQCPGAWGTGRDEAGSQATRGGASLRVPTGGTCLAEPRKPLGGFGRHRAKTSWHMSRMGCCAARQSAQGVLTFCRDTAHTHPGKASEGQRQQDGYGAPKAHGGSVAAAELEVCPPQPHLSAPLTSLLRVAPAGDPDGLAGGEGVRGVGQADGPHGGAVLDRLVQLQQRYVVIEGEVVEEGVERDALQAALLHPRDAALALVVQAQEGGPHFGV